MNFEDIKKMDKKQFEQFIFNIQNTKKKFCVRCGNFTVDKITISVNKSEKTNYNSKKLCNICQECDSDMLDYLGVSDVEQRS